VERNGRSAQPSVRLLISLNKTVQLRSNKTDVGGIQSVTTLKGWIDRLACRACGIDFGGSEHGLKHADGVSPFGVSPFGVSPFGVSPFGVSPFGVSPFGVSPFGVF
jgi:hypothetical protein